MKRLVLFACAVVTSCAQQRVVSPIDAHNDCGSRNGPCNIWIRTPTGKAPTEAEKLEPRLRLCYARLSANDVSEEQYSYPSPKLDACMAEVGWHYQRTYRSTIAN
jgi:hypothetical protein